MRLDEAEHSAGSATDRAARRPTGCATPFAANLALELASDSILAALLELDRARRTAARLVDAAECRTREVVREHTAAGTLTDGQAEALLARSLPGAAGVPRAGALEVGLLAGLHAGLCDAGDPGERPRRDGDDLLDLRPVDRLLGLFAVRLPSRNEVQGRS